MKKAEAALHRFVVLGAARSGIAAARLLKLQGADVVVADNKPADQALETQAELRQLDIPSAWGDVDIHAAIAGRHIMVKSPGIPPNNPIVVDAVAAGSRVISEIELASAFAPDGARVIAITGTNGKTTVTAWLAHVLNACGFNAIPAGNIGDAWCNQLLKAPAQISDVQNTIYVVEVSSFQLENLEDFHPDVAILTNITPDHMDRYDDRLDLYVEAKSNIVKNLDSEDVFIWNAANPESQQIAKRSKADNQAFNAAGKNQKDQLAAWVEDTTILTRIGNDAVEMLSARDLPLPGGHNLENALCVILAALAVGATPQDITAAIKTFSGVEHRIELCATRADGVRFYNDSKATNLDAMEKAVVSFVEPMVLIAGGRDAHSDYASIAGLIEKHVSHLITLGEAAELIEAAWGNLAPTRRARSMVEAVEMANEAAVTGSVVVFSPACKSFDMYGNYEERGRDFKKEVSRVLAQK